MPSAYCPTCRTEHEVPENPPYAVIHVVDTKAHLHAVTREPLT